MSRNQLLLCLIAGAFFFSCKKENGNIKVDGQQGTDLTLWKSDTFTLLTRTVDEDSLKADSLSYALMGAYHDAEIGYSKATIFANLQLLEPGVTMPVGGTIDSAILHIPMVSGLNFFGNFNSVQRIGVYQLVDPIEPLKNYLQDEPPARQNTLIGYYEGRIYNTYRDSVRYGTGKLELAPGIRIRLTQDFAAFLLNAPASAVSTQTEFLKYTKGIALVPLDDDLTPGEGGMVVLDMHTVLNDGYKAKIIAYYNDTSDVVFGFTGRSETVNSGVWGGFKSAITQQVNAAEGTTFSRTYATALSGVKTQIAMPSLLNLVKDGPVAVNYASIEIKVDPATAGYFTPPPPRLNLLQPAFRGSVRNALIADFISTSEYGGVYNSTTHTYKFVITRHIQELLSAMARQGKDINLPLYLSVPSDSPVSGARAIFDHSLGTKLTITYTKLN